MAKLERNKNSRKPYELIETTGAPTGIIPTLTLIANYRGYLRFLYSEDLSEPGSNGNEALELHGAKCVTRTPGFIRSRFDSSLKGFVSIRRKGNLYVVESKKGEMVSLPSKRPYKVVKLTHKKNNTFKTLFDSGEQNGLEHFVEIAIATMASIEGFSTKTSRRFLFWERKELVTPDYADQYEYWKALIKGRS